MQALPASLRRSAAKVGAAVADLLCPPVCVACQASISISEGAFCSDCRSDLVLFDTNACRRCGAPTASPQLSEETVEPCARCRDQRLRFDEVVVLGEYEGLLRELALRSKQLAYETVAAALGEMIADRAGERLASQQADVVTSVPMHWTRRLVRQTNGPERMADALARRLGLECAPQLLRRVRRTKPQAQLAKSQRAGNVRRAFRVSPGFRLRGATVLLVDDILTTGATCNEAAAELKRAGAGRVVAVVAARAL